jgi:hypothetical protein
MITSTEVTCEEIFSQRHRIDVVTEPVGYLLRDRTGAWRVRGPNNEVLSGLRPERLFLDGPEDALCWLLRARGVYRRLLPQLFFTPAETEEAPNAP